MNLSARNLSAILQDFGDMPICGRCLVVLDARMSVRAKHPNGASDAIQDITNPLYLKGWVISHLLESPEYRFEIGPTTDRFIPIATMYGDPVCAYDLYNLVAFEARRNR